LVKRKINK